MTLSQYPALKNSDVTWLGSVPEHWKLIRFRFLFSFGRGLGITKSNLLDEGVPCVNYGEIHSKYGFEVIPEQHRLKCVAPDYLERGKSSLLENGDFVFADTSEDFEGSGNFTYLNSNTPTFAGYHTVIARPTSDDVSRYMAYLFDSLLYRYQIRKSVSGVKVFSITQEILKNCYVWLPAKQEQTQIAKFLDYKTTQIDRLIEKKKALIEKLNEQRIAVITQAVTKGLNPDAPVKDSEVEWLGEVPEHWEVLKLRFLGECQNGINIGGEYFGRGYPFVSYSDVYNNRELPKEVTGLVESSTTDRKLYSVQSGDLLFTRTSETIEEIAMTSVCMIGIEDSVFAGFLIRFRPNQEQLTKEFSKYYFQNELLRAFFVKEMNLVTRASLSQELLKNLPVLLPPEDEQEVITSYLEREVRNIDRLISANQQTIEKLEEYRTALITTAVTGKIDVRHVEIPEQESA